MKLKAPKYTFLAAHPGIAKTNPLLLKNLTLVH